MKLPLLAGLVATGMALAAGGVAVAQTASPPPPPPAEGPMGGPPGGPPGDGMRGPGPGHGGGHHGRMHGRPPPPSKAAYFHVRRGDARVDIKCAEDEPMKACVEAGSALLDKLAAQPR